tara:strand:- start:436 stop:777 length:342 start_codon:yes stop_codon:yes gene_type:complete
MILDKYLKLKCELDQAKRWADLIGKKYLGGNGGTGFVTHPSLGSDCISIYHQACDGATNYHKVPNKSTVSALKNAIDWEKSISRAIETMEEDIEELKREAKREYLSLFSEEMA